MNTNWTQILVFTILALVLGFVLGRVTSHSKRGHHPGKEKRMMMCGENGPNKKDCRKKCADSERSRGFDKEGELEAIIASIEASGFEGDTTFVVDGAKVELTRQGEEVRVEVKKEIREGKGPKEKRIRVLEKEVEMN